MQSRLPKRETPRRWESKTANLWQSWP